MTEPTAYVAGLPVSVTLNRKNGTVHLSVDASEVIDGVRENAEDHVPDADVAFIEAAFQSGAMTAGVMHQEAETHLLDALEALPSFALHTIVAALDFAEDAAPERFSRLLDMARRAEHNAYVADDNDQGEDVRTAQVRSGDTVIGQIEVHTEGDSEPIQVAAAAYGAIDNLVVDGQRFTLTDLREWWA